MRTIHNEEATVYIHQPYNAYMSIHALYSNENIYGHALQLDCSKCHMLTEIVAKKIEKINVPPGIQNHQKLPDDLFQKVYCQNDGCKELAEVYANDGTLDAICTSHLR